MNDLLKLESQLCFPLYVCSKEIIRKYKLVLDPYDLTYTQYIAMLVLWEEEPMNVKTLGERLFLDSGTLTPLLRKLEQKGYIKKSINKTDERNQIIEVTPKGKDLKEEIQEVPLKMGKCVELSSEEASFLYQTLYKIIQQMNDEKNTSLID